MCHNKEKEMLELSEEELKLLYGVLIKAKNQEKSAGFNIEKLMIDSFGSSDQKYYDHTLHKIEDEIRHMDILEDK
jgi:hypothetical protein